MSIFIGVGSNIKPEDNILKAVDSLAKHVRIMATSNFYLTRPIGDVNQDAYYNGVWEIETSLPPMELKLKVLREVEEACGRLRSTNKYAPRKIDMDLLLYHNEIINTPDLQLPDPDIYKRNFIALPLYEIQPELLVPDTRSAIYAIISSMSTRDMQLLERFTSVIQEKIRQYNI